jgi:hypothetical protein
MCSILCWILSIWEALGCIFCIFVLIHALSTRGKSLSMFWPTECIQKIFRWFWAISGLYCAQVWPVRCVGHVHMLGTGLTGGVNQSDRSELSYCSCSIFEIWFACIRPGGVALFQGELACVHGELFVVFRALDWWFVLFAWACFVSDVSSRCPCLRGLRLVFFKWSCSLPFLSFNRLMEFLLVVSFFVFSWLPKHVCCQCTHQGGDWEPCVVRGPVDGRILVWWEWFTTWCGLILD